METFAVTLPGELKPFVDAQVASGKYASADEFVRTVVESVRQTICSGPNSVSIGDNWSEKQLESFLLEGINSGPSTEWTHADVVELRRRIIARHGQASEAR